jgi:SAM-dependent methyltransferase
MTLKCPICSIAYDSTPLCKVNLGYDEEFDLEECPTCRVRYLNPMPTQSQLSSFYQPQYYGSDWYKQLGLGMAFARSALKGLKPGRFLDIGCGLGYFIKGVADNSAWVTSGMEFSDEAARYARDELGLDVAAGDLSDRQWPDQAFDYIHIRNVLEHVTDPAALLKECRRIIKPDGTLHLLVPNGPIDSEDLIKFYRKEKRAPLSPSGHLFFFSPASLEQLFRDAGFEIRRSRTYGIRRGLSKIGLWPHFKDWTAPYRRRLSDIATTGSGEISLPAKRERPDIYYRYRQLRMNARMLPGLRSFGLDFELLLKPSRRYHI